ncbi:MAG TPA: molybdenum cofactor guanylyltransferase MobA [Gammaproteobacteria bacterium]|jgi:molybdenum cofactor guanylyltransferase
MNHPDVTALVLAGGRGQRMGGTDKGLIELSGKPMIEHILERLEPQCDHIIINANRNVDRYAVYGHPVLRDSLGDYQGPLAGFSTGLKHAKTPFIMTLPCDAPDLPADLVERMLTVMNGQQADITVAHDGERMQPVYALIKTALHENLDQFLASGDRKIDRWYAMNNTVTVDFSDMRDIFRNVNTPEQINAMSDIGQT